MTAYAKSSAGAVLTQKSEQFTNTSPHNYNFISLYVPIGTDFQVDYTVTDYSFTDEPLTNQSTSASSNDVSENKELRQALTQYMSDSLSGTSWYPSIKYVFGYNLPYNSFSAVIYADTDTDTAKTITLTLQENYTTTKVSLVMVLKADGTEVLYSTS